MQWIAVIATLVPPRLVTGWFYNAAHILGAGPDTIATARSHPDAAKCAQTPLAGTGGVRAEASSDQDDASGYQQHESGGEGGNQVRPQ